MFWRLRAVLRPPRGRPGRHPAVAAVLAAGGALVVAACGAGSSPHSPAVAAVPLVPGTRELILAAGPSHFEDSGVLEVAERRALRRAGWRRSEGDTYDESAAESPHNRLRVTYATAEQDLLSIDERRIARTPAITHQLAEMLFAGEPALSLLVQAGSG
jgi:hypothetical protein